MSKLAARDHVEAEMEAERGAVNEVPNRNGLACVALLLPAACK